MSNAELYFRTDDKSNKFTDAPLFRDWKVRSEPNKAGLATFRSPKYFSGGTHVRIMDEGEALFGGQIVKPGEKKNDFYSYEARDYKGYLLREYTINKTNIKASSFAKLLAKKVPKLKWNVKKTKHKYSRLHFKDKTILSILNQLIWLEYKEASNLILFKVDADRKLTFKPYPTKIKGYIFTEALDYESTLDHSDIRTGYEIVDENGNVKKSYANKKLQALWGEIPIQGVYDSGSD